MCSKDRYQTFLGSRSHITSDLFLRSINDSHAAHQHPTRPTAVIVINHVVLIVPDVERDILHMCSKDRFRTFLGSSSHSTSDLFSGPSMTHTLPINISHTSHGCHRHQSRRAHRPQCRAPVSPSISNLSPPFFCMHIV